MTDSPNLFADSPAAPAGDVARDVLSELLDAVGLHGDQVFAHLDQPPGTSAIPGGMAMVHLVDEGSVELVVPVDGSGDSPPARALLGPGDLALVPHGHAHVAHSHAGPGSAGRPTAGPRWMTGSVVFDSIGAEPMMQSLPPILVLAASDDPEDEWRTTAMRVLELEVTRPNPGGHVMASRILDLLFIQMLRVWASTTPDRTGWLRAAMDPAIGPALTAIHSNPAHPWSVTDLANLSNLARSTFSERFTSLLGLSPVAYLTAHRLDSASNLLRLDRESVAKIGHRVGYSSEAAFSRAFRRRFGLSPREWRAGRGDA